MWHIYHIENQEWKTCLPEVDPSMEIITRVSYRQSVQLNSSELLRGTIEVFERGILVATFASRAFFSYKIVFLFTKCCLCWVYEDHFEMSLNLTYPDARISRWTLTRARHVVASGSVVTFALPLTRVSEGSWWTWICTHSSLKVWW